jgi:hypothetical protein
MLKGAGGRSAADIAGTLEGMGARLRPVSSRDVCGFSLGVQSRDLGPAMDLFATHAGFDASVMIVHRTVANFSRLALHRLLRTTVRIANDCVARPRAREWWEATITRERAPQ